MVHIVESYFGQYDGYWRHGDWIKITDRGSAVIYGRSDATLNRGGIRTGTAEYYRLVESIDGVTDILVVDTGGLGKRGLIVLFVVLDDNAELTEDMVAEIRRACHDGLSPRHVPDRVLQVPEVPRTLTNKKLEVPVKRILAGMDPGHVVQSDAVTNPGALDFFIALATSGELTEVP